MSLGHTQGSTGLFALQADGKELPENQNSTQSEAEGHGGFGIGEGEVKEGQAGVRGWQRDSKDRDNGLGDRGHRVASECPHWS